MMRLKQHLMTIIRLISLVPMLGDKVPFKFSLTVAVGFGAQRQPLFMTKSKGQLCTQFGAYGESLECEPCIFPTTVTLSDEEYSLTTDV